MVHIDDINKLHFEGWNRITYDGKQISHWWGKTFFYQDDKGNLQTQTLSPLGRLFRALFGRHKELTRENCWKALTERNIAKGECPGKDFRKVVAERLGVINDADPQSWGRKGRTENDIIRVFREGYDVNAVFRGMPVLYWALRENKIDLFNFLLDKGADVNLKNEKGAGDVTTTPLLLAVDRHLPDVIAKLIEKGADLTALDAYGNTVLHHAIAACPEIAQTSWIKGENRDPTVRKPIVKTLIDEHVKQELSLDTPGYNGITPLYAACERGDTEMIDWFLKAGAAVNAHEPGSLPPLCAAAEAGNLDLARKLLKKGATANPQDVPSTPAADAVDNLEMMQLLIENGADINGSAKRNQDTLLHRAIEIGNVEVARYLIQQGADLEKKGASFSYHDDNGTLHIVAEGITPRELAEHLQSPELIALFPEAE